MKKLDENTEQAMASFQLHPDEAVSEFNLLFYGVLIEFLAFIIYGIGGFMDMMILLNVGRVMSTVFIVIGLKISLNWWRRFT
jgi:hypothetical protein